MAFIMKNILFYTLLIQFSFQLIYAQRYCNGYESLCYKTYDDVVYATTHNSYAVGNKYI